MNRQYSLAYSPRLLRKGVWLYFGQVVGVWFPMVLAALAAFVAWHVVNGERSWFVGAIGAFVALVVLLIVTLVVVHLRNANANARTLDGSPVILTVAEEGLGFSSKLGTATVPWHRIESIRQYQELYLVRFRGGNYSSLPAEHLDAEAVHEIKARVAAAVQGVV